MIKKKWRRDFIAVYGENPKSYSVDIQPKIISNTWRGLGCGILLIWQPPMRRNDCPCIMMTPSSMSISPSRTILSPTIWTCFTSLLFGWSLPSVSWRKENSCTFIARAVMGGRGWSCVVSYVHATAFHPKPASMKQPSVIMSAPCWRKNGGPVSVRPMRFSACLFTVFVVEKRNYPSCRFKTWNHCSYHRRRRVYDDCWARFCFCEVSVFAGGLVDR